MDISIVYDSFTDPLLKAAPVDRPRRSVDHWFRFWGLAFIDSEKLNIEHTAMCEEVRKEEVILTPNRKLVTWNNIINFAWISGEASCSQDVNK